VQSLPNLEKGSIRVLMLQQSDVDAELIKEELGRSSLSAIFARADSRDTFIAALREFAPDVVLSNHSGGELNVVAALTLLRDVRPTAPLIVVTQAASGAEAVAYVRAGAEDLVMTQNIGRLAAAIKSALMVRRSLVTLTPRQIEVLRLVAQGRRTREIAKDLKLSVKTVESHRGEVMKRLGIRDVVSLVHYAMRVGLVASVAAQVLTLPTV
jgi:DNA-binding NarL/FixJ family response regulator